MDRGLITLPETKAGKVQFVRLNEEARAILRTRQIQEMNRNCACDADDESETKIVSPFVYPSERLVTPLDQRNFYARIFRPAVNAAKLEDGVGWHTLRHTFASRLAMSGQTEGTIAALMRHSTTALVRRYAHLSPSYLHAAVESVAAYGKPTEKSGPISSGTVTETGKGNSQKRGNEAEVIEKVGAGDGI